MEQTLDTSKLLELLPQPSFCVKENMITEQNPAAQRLLLEPGTDVRSLLDTGSEEYAAFSGGCLYLRMKLGDRCFGAAVLRTAEGDLFVLESENGELNALALAARSLRSPLGTVMLATDQLAETAPSEEMGRLNRGLNQLLRLVNNMSDALLYTGVSQQETQNLSAVFEEIFEKARAILAQAGWELTYDGLREEAYGLADAQQLERAVLNILSNAMKFAGGRITASLTRHGRMLHLSILDEGPGIREDILSGIFHRYLRQPGIEDSRFGLGLGMVLIRTAAVNHGGTVLIDQPKGARITMTIALRQADTCSLRSPALRMDYAGDRDHALVELSESLPAKLYERKRK